MEETRERVAKRMHTELINQEGIIEDEEIETYYFPCERVGQADGYLRLIGDAGAYNFETRLQNDSLIHWGWIQKTEGDKLRADKNELLAALENIIWQVSNNVPWQQIDAAIKKGRAAIAKVEAK